MTIDPTDWRNLPLADRPVTDEEIQQELEDLTKGILPPKLNFTRLRKAILDPVLLELGFREHDIGFCRELDAFMVSIEIMRDKSNRSFRIDLGFHPLALWDRATHGDRPATASLFRGGISFPGGMCWWKHGLDEAVTREVLLATASYLRAELMPGLRQVVDFCETATPSRLVDMPAWLFPPMSDAVSFARYRQAAGRKAEAAGFARAALDAMPPPGPLAHLQPPRPIELEMRLLADQ